MNNQASHLLASALAYSDLGYSLLACAGKKPAVNWSAFQQRPAHPDTIRKWAECGLLQNVGIICGHVSGNLVVIDLDGLDAVDAYTRRFPHLLDTYTVSSGSGQGQHIYYIVKELPPTTRAMGTDVGNVELRSDGCYVVAPPSIHPDTKKPYTVLHPLPVRILPNMWDVVAWVKSLIAEKHGAHKSSAAIMRGANRWATAALAAECRAVELAPGKSRNNTLNRAAFKLGQIVAIGLLSRGDCERQLEAAAAGLAKDDGLSSVMKTIKSGLDAGIQNPRRS